MKITELFRLVENATVFTVTSSDKEVVYSSETYTPVAVGRTEVESKNELSRANIELTFGIDNEIAQRYMNTVVDAVVSLTVFSQEDGDTNVVWKGRLSAVKPQESNVKLIFESVFTSLRRPGLRARYQRNCRHMLYGRGCRLNKEDFDVAGTATAIAGTVVTVAAAAGFPNGWFAGGMLEAPDLTLRFITSHTGSQLTLIRKIDSLSAAIVGGPQSVRIFPGCDRSRETCVAKFNNLNNNGSFPFIPTRNPFNGASFG